MLLYYLYAVLGMSIVCFLLFGIDKLCAIAKKSRIPERTLIGCMWLLGACGGLFGMCLFGHKTSHWYFACNGVAALLVHLALAWLLAWQFSV